MIRRVDVKDACGFITYSDILPILNISQATLFRSIKKGSFPPPDGTINKVKYYRKETIFKAALKTKGLDVAMHYAKQMDFDFSHLELNDIEKEEQIITREMFDVEKVTDLPIDVLRQTRMQLDYNDNPELLFMGFFRRYEFECGVKAIPEPIDVNKIHRFQDHSLVKLHKYDIRLSLLTGIKDLFKEEEMTELSLLINKDFKWKEFTIYGNSWNDVIFKYNRH